MTNYLIVKNNFKVVMTGVILSMVLFRFSIQILAAQANAVPKTAAEAISLAQNNGQYLFLLFYDNRAKLYYDNSEKLFNEMKIVVDDFRKKSSEKILFYKVLVTDDKEKDTVSKYEIKSSRLPQLLTFAPTGAATGVFPKRVTIQNLTQSIVSKLAMNILKSIQEDKIALVLLQNSSTKFNSESSKAAQELADDSNFKGKVDIIKADPMNNMAKDFLAQINIKKPVSESTIILIVSPGSVVGVYSGIITKERIIGALTSGTSYDAGSGSACVTGTGSGGAGCCGSK